MTTHPRHLLTVAMMVTLLSFTSRWNVSYASTTPFHPSDDRIWRANEVDHQPEALNYDLIVEGMGYPQAAYDAGIQGEVTLQVLVDEKGNYVSHEVVSSFHPLLRIPCEIFSSLLTFKPALKEGMPVKCYTEVTYHFEIPGYGQ